MKKLVYIVKTMGEGEEVFSNLKKVAIHLNMDYQHLAYLIRKDGSILVGNTLIQKKLIR